MLRVFCDDRKVKNKIHDNIYRVEQIMLVITLPLCYNRIKSLPNLSHIISLYTFFSQTFILPHPYE